jgi:hypothetical protein
VEQERAEMNSIVRWFVAGLVTIAAFGVAAWTAEALALPHVIKDPGIRWGLAGALGVAVAAIAALWGHSFATDSKSGEAAPGDSDPSPTPITTGFGHTHNEISGGTFYHPVIQGRDFSGPISGSAATPPTPSGENQ